MDIMKLLAAQEFPVAAGEDIAVEKIAGQAFTFAKKSRDGLPGRPQAWTKCADWESLCDEFPEVARDFRESVGFVYAAICSLGYEVVETGVWLPRTPLRVSVKPRAERVEKSPKTARIPRTQPVSSKTKGRT